MSKLRPVGRPASTAVHIYELILLLQVTTVGLYEDLETVFWKFIQRQWQYICSQ